jgi:hypothetical protein
MCFSFIMVTEEKKYKNAGTMFYKL